MASRVFAALLKYWRGRRGLSQLDLALEAGVSPRHVSFLESGRSQPGPAMVRRLLGVLRVSLREQNQALRAAGFEPSFAEPAYDALPPDIDAALGHLLEHHEPYPMTVVTPDGSVVRANDAAPRVFGAFVADPSALPRPLDMVSLLFDPRLMRPFILDWDTLAHAVVTRLQRERLEREDPRLTRALERALAFPGVPRAWKTPDLSRDAAPALSVRLRRDRLRVAFLLTLTTLSAPQQVTLEELRIEAALPLDEETRRVCRRLARGPRRR